MALLLTTGLLARTALEYISSPAAPSEAPQRIVSFAPSVTETLYALGLGDSVAGVTQYCIWPEDVAAKPRVAGFSDINYEAVVRCQPDLAVLPTDKTAHRHALHNLGIPVLTLDTRSLQGFLLDLERLGTAAGRRTEAAAIVADFDAAISMAYERARGRKRPRVLFSVMHSYEGLGYINEIHAVGQDGFYSELIRAAGGDNVYSGPLAFPRLSREAVLFLNPDIIVDVIPGGGQLAGVRQDWQSLHSVSAIRSGRLYFLVHAADTVPGPRSVGTLHRLSRAFFPLASDPPISAQGVLP
ncbi:MAG: ABC transporter substrate-binding protein [Desulfovibrio sp.]|nr:ABC transporter substrate-binding protein [Desulfovibrio sp.]